jgi:hypothetical protein
MNLLRWAIAGATVLALLVALFVIAITGFELFGSRSVGLKLDLPGPMLDTEGNSEGFLGRAVFSELGGRDRRYGVVTYGRRVELKAGNQGFLFVDGTSVEIPAEKDVVWAVAPDRSLHKLDVSLAELVANIQAAREADFFASPLWKDALKPALLPYRWKSP